MIQERLAKLDQAAGNVIELMRGASQPEEIVLASIERLARGACCERAAYWMLDVQPERIRRMAIWSAWGLKVRRLGKGSQRPNLSLSESNATHVWRTRKPIWTMSLVLAPPLPTGSPQSAGADLQSGVWFAVKTDTAMYGVIELIGREFAPRTAAHLTTVERIGARLGHALEAVRGAAPPPQLH